MNDCSPSNTSWYHRRQQRSEYRNFFASEIDSNRPKAKWCTVNLTLKQGLMHGGSLEMLTRDKVSKCIGQLMHCINKRVYKHAVHRFKKRLVCIPAIERGELGRLHIHMLLEIPPHMENEADRFFHVVKAEWQKIRWAHTQMEIRRLRTDQDVENWTKYISKDLSENDETLDLANLHLGRLAH